MKYEYQSEYQEVGIVIVQFFILLGCAFPAVCYTGIGGLPPFNWFHSKLVSKVLYKNPYIFSEQFFWFLKKWHHKYLGGKKK